MEQDIQTIIKQIDLYIEESLDENFDRYLEQMKRILIEEPARAAEVGQAIERNILRYRENIRKNQSLSTEFKIGAGVLSGIGILFVLIAAVILGRNFLPEFFQGMLMLVFFSLVWVIGQMGIVRVSPKLALGCSGAGILGLYLSVVMNYYVFETMPRILALGLLALIGIVSWCVSYVVKSRLLQYMSFGGYLLFAMILPWGRQRPEFIVSLLVMIVLNLMWHLGASGEKPRQVQLVHSICYIVYSMVYGVILLVNQPEGGLVMVLIYGMISAALLNIFCFKKQGTGFFCTWLCGAIFQTAFLMGIVLAMMWFHYSLFTGQQQSSRFLPLILLALPAVNVLLLFLQSFKKQYQGLYYQSAVLIFALSATEAKLPVLLAGILLFVIGLFKIRELRLLHQLLMALYFYAYAAILLPQEAVAPAQVGILLGLTLMYLYVPQLRCRWEAALVYTNVSLMGLSLLQMAFHENYISYTVTLVLAVAAVFLLWKKRCYLPEKYKFLMLALLLSYMLLVYRIQMPFVVSIVLMLLSITAIVAGFIRREAALRIYGLCMALFVCAKVVLYDFWYLDLLPKSLLFLAIGLIAIVIAIIYAVLEVKQRKNA